MLLPFLMCASPLLRGCDVRNIIYDRSVPRLTARPEKLLAKNGMAIQDRFQNEVRDDHGDGDY